MATEENKDLVPDKKILSDIFPSIATLDPSACQVISNTWDTCTFLVRFEQTPPLNYPGNVIVRLETSKGRLQTLAIIQRLAHSHLGDVVPSVLEVGITTNTAPKKLDYIVTTYISNATTLEEVWNTTDATHQRELVASVANMVKKLQRLDSDTLAKELAATPFVTDIDNSPKARKLAIGGPALGYFSDVHKFLNGLILDGRPSPCKILELEDGISLQSEYEDIGRIELSQLELDEILHSIVLCHNDVEPRNIIVRNVSSGKYEVAGIIDWEMAGIFPFVYEYGVKDGALGSSNLYFDWYTLYKSQTSHLLPPAECHTKLLKALRTIDESRKRSMARNVGVRFQKKWVQRERVEESPDLRQGWIRKAGMEAPGAFTKNDQNKLELEALKELGLI